MPRNFKVALEASGEPLVKRATDNLDAYQLYLKARFLMNQRGGAIVQGLELLRQAIAMEPGYASAHAALADAYALLGFYGYAPSYEVMPKARQSAQHALVLNPSLAEAHAPLLFVSWIYDWDFERAQREFDTAMALDPCMVTALNWWALYLGMVAGRFEEGMAVARRACEIDPLSAYSYVAVGGVGVCAGRFAEAEAAARRAIELSSNLWLGHRVLGVALSMQGRHDEAIAVLERALPLSRRHAWMIITLAVCHGWAGRAAGARRYHDELVAIDASGTYVQPMMLATTYGALGELDACFEWAERAYRERDPLLAVMNYWPPSSEASRRDPRFAALLARVGVPLAPDLRGLIEP